MEREPAHTASVIPVYHAVGWEDGNFSGIFEIVAAARGWSGEKRRPVCGGTSIAVPTSPLAPLLPRSTSAPLRPKGANGPESDGQPRFVTDHPQPHPACCPASDADPLRCASEERYWRYRTALVSKVAGNIARATAWLRAWPDEQAHVGCALLDERARRFDSRGRFFDGSPACRRRTSAASLWSREVQRIHDPSAGILVVRHEVTGFRRWRLAQCTTAASRAPTWPLSGQ
jgi:hypothetical protein